MNAFYQNHWAQATLTGVMVLALSACSKPGDGAVMTPGAVNGSFSVESSDAHKVTLPSVGNKLDDSVITGKVKAALLKDPSIHSLDIHVITRIDEVLLSGFVDTQAQMDRAMQLAVTVAGEHHVTNGMKLKQ